MSIGMLGGIAGSVAGAPLAQAKGPDVERAQQDVGAHQRRAEGQQKAESAAGIGQTDEDQQTGERDADGRLPWQVPARPDDGTDEDSAAGRPQANDPDGHSGSLLDLMG
jgi:hypothetical protein